MMTNTNVTDFFFKFRLPSTPEVTQAFELFFNARAKHYYTHFGKQHCFDTYIEHNFAHTVQDPPFLIIFNPRDMNHFIFENRFKKDAFIFMANFFDVTKMDFHYMDSAKELCTSASKKEANPRSPYILNDIGGETLNEFKSVGKNHYVTEYVYYLLPEDYHYFKTILPLFKRKSFLPTHTPSLLEE